MRQPTTARRARARDRTGAAHYCPVCGRRTYRKVRRIPVLDERCSRCAELGYFPGQTGSG